MDEVKRKYREQKRKTETFVISLIAIIVIIGLPIAIYGKRIQLKIKKSSMDSQVEAYYVTVDRTIKNKSRRNRLYYYEYTAIFLYEVNGETYRYCTQIKNASKVKNETTIYYDSKDPNNCVSEFELKENSIH